MMEQELVPEKEQAHFKIDDMVVFSMPETLLQIRKNECQQCQNEHAVRWKKRHWDQKPGCMEPAHWLRWQLSSNSE